jgi:hypothetical protein
MTTIFTTGQVLTASQMNTYTSNAAASAYLTSSASIPNISDSIVTWNAEEYDNDSMWTSGSATRITINTEGIYVVCYTLAWAANTTGERIGWVQKNGSSSDRWGMVRTQASSGVGETIQNGVSIIKLNATDYIQVGVYQASGGNLNLLGTGTARTRFSAARVSAS